MYGIRRHVRRYNLLVNVFVLESVTYEIKKY